MFDPNVNADGQKAGRGVGGMQEQAVRDEGAEHIVRHVLSCFRPWSLFLVPMSYLLHFAISSCAPGR